MLIGTNCVNTGLISQNYDVISRISKKYAGNTVEDLEEKSSGTMTEISDEELKAIRQKAQNESKTLSVDSSEIVKDIFCKTGDNITYDVDGVTFTNKEMKACKEVVKNALAALPIMGSDLDYKDYAAMGIAANMVSSYARENLTKEQAEIVNKSMEEYFNSLMQAEKERQSRSGYFTDDTNCVGNTGELNTYYNVRCGISSEAAASLKSQLLNLPEQTRTTLLANLEGTQNNGSVVQSASNKDLAVTIKALFQNVNLKDTAAVNNTLKQYQTFMTPAYKAYGLENTANSNSLTHVLGQDVSGFIAQIANAKAVIGNVGNTLSYIV